MNSFELLHQKSSGFIDKVSQTMISNFSSLRSNRSKEIVSYQPFADGHMLRPLLCHATGSALVNCFSEEQMEKLVYFAAAVELMHNASLIHDDLIDNEEMRRGKKSLHREFGFKNALLAGNIFYIKVIDISNRYLGIEQTEDILHTAVTMCEGEIIQAQYSDDEMPVEIYNEVIRYKTASLTSIACRQTAVLMGSDEVTVGNFSKLGEALGIYYQLRDDSNDKDTKLSNDFYYDKALEGCENTIHTLIEELGKKYPMNEFEAIYEYFKT